MRLLIWSVNSYAALSILAAIVLGEFAAHLPRNPVREETAFRSRVWRQFHAQVQDVSIRAADQAQLKAWYVQPPNPNGKTVILLHGIAANRVSIAGFGDIFLQHGYSILIPDSRDHGDSGGKIATFGILEREDVHRWASWLHERSPQCVYLLGESMGAAIGVQATEVTPELCAAAVESPYATFRQISYQWLGGATCLGSLFWETFGRPAIEMSYLYTRIRYGVYLPDAAPMHAVEHSHVPTLIIAGTNDRYIPMRNAQELAVQCPEHCSLWIVSGAGHGGAASVDKLGFDRRILDWFQQHETPGGLILTAFQQAPIYFIAASTSAK